MKIKTPELAVKLVEESTDRDTFAITRHGVEFTFESYGYIQWIRQHYHPDVESEEVLLAIVWGDDGFADIYRAHKQAISNIPKKWMPLIRKAVKERKQAGIDIPIDIFSICRFMFASSPELQALGKQVEIEVWEGIDLTLDETEPKQIKKFLSLVFDNAQFHHLFVEFARYYMPSMSSAEYYYAGRLIDKFEKAAKAVLDVGCGRGDRLAQLRSSLNARLVGYEIRDLPFHWNWEAYPDVKFEVIEPHVFPAQNGEFGAAMLMGIAGHWTAEALAKTLQECHRVLEPDGIVIAAPQTNNSMFEETIMGFRVYQKCEDGFALVWPE